MQKNSKLNTAKGGKSLSRVGVEGGGGVGHQGCVQALPTKQDRSSERRQSFKGETESSLLVLVFCAILKNNKINIT